MTSKVIDNRVNFGSVKNPMPLPDFLDVQLKSSSELKPDATSKKPEIYAEKMQTIIPVRMRIVMVLQTIGSATILAALNSGIKDFVLIGNLTLLPQCKEIYPMLEKMYNVHFHIPKHAEFCTAIGAALSYKR